MKLIRSLVAVVLCSCLSVGAFADTLNATESANISTSGRTSPGYLSTNWWDSEKNVGLIQFDLSSFAGATTSLATLNLFHQWNGAQGAVFNLYQNTSAWNSSISSWGDLPSHLASPVAQLIIGDSSQNIWRALDVTAAVNSWTNGSLANYGFTLERVDQDNPLAYFTSNATLDVTAAVPEPETYAMLLAGLGLMGAVARRRKARA